MHPAPVVIGDHAWLGANITVLPGVTIGDGAVVGAGSVVTHDIPEMHVVAGNPARTVRILEPSQYILEPSQYKISRQQRSSAPDN